MGEVETDRLIVRRPVEADRERFVSLFMDTTFMAFDEPASEAAANERFDQMIELARHVPYAKQPIIERSSNEVVGYTGVDTIAFEGDVRLEWGWRLTASARGQGYATEATLALLGVADAHDDGELLCLIGVANHPSKRVAEKVGFTWWRRHDWPPELGGTSDLYLRTVGAGGSALLA